MATSIHKKIEDLEKKLKQAKALAAKQKAAEAAKSAKEAKAADTRRKVLVGAFILDQQSKNGTTAHVLTYDSVRFVDWLTRPEERALFGIETTPKS